MFGSMTLVVGDAAPVALHGRGAQLLAYLALGRGRNVSRCELLERVWADRADRLSPGTFNTALWRLRRLLHDAAADCGQSLVCDAGATLAFDSGMQVWVDVAEFERLAKPGLHVTVDAITDAELAGLEAATVLYNADLLLDHSDDWVLRARERQRRTYLNVRGRLMEVALHRHAYAAAISHAHSILDCEPLREDVHRALMRAYVDAGQRALALRQFEQCRSLLRGELAIAPMPDTMALYQQIASAAVAVRASRTGPACMNGGIDAQPESGAVLRGSDGHADLHGEETLSPRPAEADLRPFLDSAQRLLRSADAQLQAGLSLLG